MTKEKIRHVQSWDGLIKFINSINPYEKTITLVGWVNEMYQDQPFIKTLVFSTRPIEILKEENDVPKETQPEEIPSIEEPRPE